MIFSESFGWNNGKGWDKGVSSRSSEEYVGPLCISCIFFRVRDLILIFEEKEERKVTMDYAAVSFLFWSDYRSGPLS